MSNSILTSPAVMGLVTDTSLQTRKPTIHTAIVVPPRLKEEWQRRFDPNYERYRFIGNNQEVRGMKFDAVLISDAARRHAYNSGRTARDRLDAWLESMVKDRCAEGAPFIDIP